MTATYRFEERWQTAGELGRVYDVLEDVAGYPSWWPEIRAVAKLADDAALVVCRSKLPATLYIELRPVVQDRASGVLHASLSGDLDGWSRFELSPTGQGLDVSYTQEVHTPGWLLRLGARIARPLLLWNHDQMMRSMRHGLASEVVA